MQFLKLDNADRIDNEMFILYSSKIDVAMVILKSKDSHYHNFYCELEVEHQKF